MHNNSFYEWILQSTFTVSGREQSAKPIFPP
jgi:hypothetical protein